MPPDEGQASPEELQRSAEEIIREMVRSGAIEPALALECIYYAREPDLLTILRKVAALDASGRAVLAAFLSNLPAAGENPPDKAYGAH
jgi:cytosine/adenosine deaminase-related metal-dependent hydrolase